VTKKRGACSALFYLVIAPRGPREARPDDRLREAIQNLSAVKVWIASAQGRLAMTAKPYRAFESACYIGAMVLDQTSIACRRVVIDDRCRLPGRFFGRFATSATSELG